MFFRHQMYLGIPGAAVRPRLSQLYETGAITRASRQAVQQTKTTSMDHHRDLTGHPPPATAHVPDEAGNADLLVQILAPYSRGPVTVVSIRWCWPAHPDHPVLDANLEAGPTRTDTTVQLLLIGSLHTPAPDRTDGNLRPPVSPQTAEAFLHLIATLLADPVAHEASEPVPRTMPPSPQRTPLETPSTTELLRGRRVDT